MIALLFITIIVGGVCFVLGLLLGLAMWDWDRRQPSIQLRRDLRDARRRSRLDRQLVDEYRKRDAAAAVVDAHFLESINALRSMVPPEKQDRIVVPGVITSVNGKAV